MAEASVPDSAPVLATAMEVVGRASGNSDVLSNNLSSLGMLMALKAGALAYSMFSSDATARSSSGSSVTTPSPAELTGGMCFIMWAAGENNKLECIARAACESSSDTKTLLYAAKLWYKMHQVIEVVPFNEKYIEVMDTLEGAEQHREDGGDCKVFRW